jgi:hypothetical protein
MRPTLPSSGIRNALKRTWKTETGRLSLLSLSSRWRGRRNAEGPPANHNSFAGIESGVQNADLAANVLSLQEAGKLRDEIEKQLATH